MSAGESERDKGAAGEKTSGAGPAEARGEAPGETIETAVDPDGKSLTLRRAAGGFEILSAGQVVMQSALRRSERELFNLAMVPLRDRHDITVLLAGLGMGHLLASVLDSPRVIRVDVVEHCPAIIDWNRTHLSTLHREPPLADSRVHVHPMGLSAYLRAMRYGTLPEVKLDGGGYLALLLDLDHGPSALSRTTACPLGDALARQVPGATPSSQARPRCTLPAGKAASATKRLRKTRKPSAAPAAPPASCVPGHTPRPRTSSYSSPSAWSVSVDTDNVNRGTMATCSSDESSPCQRSISAVHNSMARFSEVISGAADGGPTVCTPRPLTSRSPAPRVSVNRASWASGNADPNTIAAVVPERMRAVTKSRAICAANSGSAAAGSRSMPWRYCSMAVLTGTPRITASNISHSSAVVYLARIRPCRSTHS